MVRVCCSSVYWPLILRMPEISCFERRRRPMRWCIRPNELQTAAAAASVPDSPRRCDRDRCPPRASSDDTVICRSQSAESSSQPQCCPAPRSSRCTPNIHTRCVYPVSSQLNALVRCHFRRFRLNFCSFVLLKLNNRLARTQVTPGILPLFLLFQGL